jgi:hypothetical protein
MLYAVELRVAEALLDSRVTEALWSHAGQEQLGRRNCLFSLYVEIDTDLIRAELNLPSGNLWTDREDAFATTPPELVVTECYGAGLRGHELALVDAMVANPAVFVVQDEYRSECQGTIARARTAALCG